MFIGFIDIFKDFTICSDILDIFEDFYVSFHDKTPLIWYPDERLRQSDLVYDPKIFKTIDIRKFDPRDYENVVIF